MDPGERAVEDDHGQQQDSKISEPNSNKTEKRNSSKDQRVLREIFR
jgi:hypothetical protein